MHGSCQALKETSMNNKVILTVIALIALLSSCNQNYTRQDFDLGGLNATITLPGYYKNVETLDINSIIKNKELEYFKKDLIKFIAQNPEDVFIIDTINPMNFIFISQIEPYVKIDSMLYYRIIMKEDDYMKSRKESDSVFYYGSKMGKIGNLEFIESKYRNNDILNRQRFTYGFILSSEQNSTGITFSTTEEDNIADYLNTIKEK